ncbi:hypothetical protein BLTE_29350 [Blastochloris tepida]|uniref:Uncharacterized protein n=1 Tax=Blastochloris tepida TaxID=2233851 RepID=A0A348G3W7_9HYPH|nr:hypothetical protein BLTE_29350 [Blastochloris tepida]
MGERAIARSVSTLHADRKFQMNRELRVSECGKRKGLRRFSWNSRCARWRDAVLFERKLNHRNMFARAAGALADGLQPEQPAHELADEPAPSRAGQSLRACQRPAQSREGAVHTPLPLPPVSRPDTLTDSA